MLVALPTLGVMLLGGSLHSPSSAPSPASKIAYHARSAPLPSSLLDRPNPGLILLEQSIEHCKRIKWLRTNVHIARHDGKLSFVTDGKLIRGDNHCVHMDLCMKTTRSKAGLKVMIVGDGFLLAEYRKFGERTAKITAVNMPCRESLDSSAYSPSREKVLADFGCAGPRPLLEEIRELLTETTVSQGELENLPVYRIEGEVDANHPRLQLKQAAQFRVDRCAVLLDSATLWPLRIEWRRGESLVFETDFRDPQVGQPLTYDECVQLFTLKEEPVD
jgi:hypothetical protein